MSHVDEKVRVNERRLFNNILTQNLSRTNRSASDSTNNNRPVEKFSLGLQRPIMTLECDGKNKVAEKPNQFVLKPLPYALDALEPVISAEIMAVHYGKHHQAYVNNLNAVAIQYDAAFNANDVDKMNSLQQNFRFNYGGHVNHQFYWENLSPINVVGGVSPTGDLMSAIVSDFGSLDAFILKFNAVALAVQGSGWAVLGINKEMNRLQIVQCLNQEPFNTLAIVPILGVDVWEHAYYLQYKNLRAEYLKSIWKIVNWSVVADRFQAVKGASKL